MSPAELFAASGLRLVKANKIGDLLYLAIAAGLIHPDKELTDAGADLLARETERLEDAEISQLRERLQLLESKRASRTK